MKILYDNTNGRIYYAVYDNDWFGFSHTANIPLTELTIDEVAPSNQAVCQDLVRIINRTDSNLLGKYYIAGGVLIERDGWTEYVTGAI